MAKKKAVKKKSVSKKSAALETSTSKAIVSWKEQLAALAETESDRTTTIGGGGANIRLSKSGFKFQGEDLGTEINVVIIDFVSHKTYFDRPFDEDNPAPPACFALSVSGKNMEPDETSPVPQSEDCKSCWAGEWKSDNRGKGKACRDAYMLAVIAENQLGVEDPDVAYMKVPPTSLSAFDAYMVKRNKVMKLPALAFVTNISFDEESEYQKLLFGEAGRVADAHFPVLMQLREVVREVMMTPPDASNYEEPGPKKRAASKKVVSKKFTKKKAVSKKKGKSKSRYS